MSTLDQGLIDRLLSFRKRRDWEQFHTVRNLSASLVIEASELLEFFRWARDEELNQIITDGREGIEDELADVAILLTYLCVDMKIDLDVAVGRKLEKNAVKYPANRARGIANAVRRLHPCSRSALGIRPRACIRVPRRPS
ncbi:MAG: nucleotide pyrophosphohydrolase [Gammaproteobacteria bacterium]|nr:nucleotide pyrophosphohydrolase [Gammaproteobacteria bacterium]